jgi:hypothetical protein
MVLSFSEINRGRTEYVQSSAADPIGLAACTVDLLITHKVMLHISQNACIFARTIVGAQQYAFIMHITYCIPSTCNIYVLYALLRQVRK